MSCGSPGRWTRPFGVAFAAAFLLARRPTRGAGRYGAVLVWVATAGPLLLYHEVVARVRFGPAPHTVTQRRLAQVREALRLYARDCGSAPSEAQGLNALCENPRVPNWSGPYHQPPIPPDAWSNPLRYENGNGQVRVWSCGPDGKDGTEDDIDGGRH